MVIAHRDKRTVCDKPYLCWTLEAVRQATPQSSAALPSRPAPQFLHRVHGGTPARPHLPHRHTAGWSDPLGMGGARGRRNLRALPRALHFNAELPFLVDLDAGKMRDPPIR